MEHKISLYGSYDIELAMTCSCGWEHSWDEREGIIDLDKVNETADHHRAEAEKEDAHE